MADYNSTHTGTQLDAAVDAVAELSTAIGNKANIDGYYATLGAGVADNLTGKGSVMAKFTRRTSGGTADIGSGSAQIKSIHGNTIVWNQQIPNGKKSFTNAITDTRAYLDWFLRVYDGSTTSTLLNITPSVGHFERIITSTQTGKLTAKHNGLASDITMIPYSENVEVVANHKYLLMTDFSGVDPTTIDGISYNNFSLIDLTQMFGAGNEPSTVNQFRDLFPLDYYAYNAGELLSFNGTGIKTNGFNQWDEVWRRASLNTTNGTWEQIGTYSQIASTNMIPVFPSTTYSITKPSASGAWIAYYDINGAFISASGLNAGASVTFNTPSNCYNIMFQMMSYGTTYHNDICINLSWSGVRNGEYEAYWDSTLALPISTYFANGMRSAGSAYDELTPSKAITRIGAVDLGSLTWSLYSTNQFRCTAPPFNMKLGGGEISANAICSLYTSVPYLTSVSDKWIKLFYSDGTRQIIIKDTSYTDAATFKTAMSGVYLFYELKTPTETAISPELNLNYRVDDFGTENLLPVNDDEPTTSPIIMDVKYAMNAVDTLRNLDKNYVNTATLDALLTVLGTACNGTFTKTWDGTNRKYTFTFTPDETE